MTQSDPIVIVGASRTAIGSFRGTLSHANASTLGSAAIIGALDNAGLSVAAVEEIIMGCVLPAGQGQAPARQAAIKAGLSLACGATTINKMCGSGMKAAMLAHDLVYAGSAAVMVAGGMESMSNAPYLLPKMRDGARLGHAAAVDHMFMDGLEDAYDKGRLMGTFADDCAQALNFSRKLQDNYAIASLERAQKSIANGSFAAEISPVAFPSRNSSVVVETDELPGKARFDKIPTLKPAFRADGTVTAANASSISDGAAAIVFMRRSEAERRDLTPLAQIIGHSNFADAPNLFPTAPIGALRRLSEMTGWSLDEVDLFEINEAFAVVALAAMQELNLPHEKVNLHGGACALGHPIGASGARVIVTLLAALQKYDLKRGIASLCIGGGEATAIGIERIS